MEKNLIKFPPIPSQLETSNIFTNLKYFGPGAIIASMTIISGIGLTSFGVIAISDYIRTIF